MDDPRLVEGMNGTASSGIPLFLPYESNSIASEANLMKMEYINSGGSDPFIIRQLNNLIAHGVSEQAANSGEHHIARRQDQITLKILEDYRHENEKLRSELETVKNEKLTDEDELSLLKKDHILKMTQMKQEFEQLQQMAKIKELKDQVMTSPDNPRYPIELDIRTASEKETLRHHSKDKTYLMSNASYPIRMDSLTLSPYDPATGFMIFHDFILNVDPSYKSIKVVARLFRANLELGTPVPLPERQCLGMHGESYSSSYLHCLIGIKQPVTKCLPSPELCLLVEIKAASHYEERLKTVCWAKFLLFDDQHRVLSGRWKVPLRVVPVRPDLHPRENNNIPQCGKMEFYYRVCNSRDSEIQSKVTAAPNLAYQYIYPPTSFDDAIYVQNPIEQPKKPTPAPAPAVVEAETKPTITYTPKKK
ncbi:coiled-coil domain-containing protein 17-like isoform X3 [Convolutriloba macropyga]